MPEIPRVKGWNEMDYRERMEQVLKGVRDDLEKETKQTSNFGHSNEIASAILSIFDKLKEDRLFNGNYTTSILERLSEKAKELSDQICDELKEVGVDGSGQGLGGTLADSEELRKRLDKKPVR